MKWGWKCQEDEKDFLMFVKISDCAMCLTLIKNGLNLCKIYRKIRASVI